MGWREAGLFAEPAGEVTRVAEACGLGGGRDASTLFEFSLGASEQFPIPPLTQGQAAGAPHQAIEVVLLQADAPRQLGGARPMPFGVRGPCALQTPQDDGATGGLGRLSGTLTSAGLDDHESRPAGREIERSTALG